MNKESQKQNVHVRVGDYWEMMYSGSLQYNIIFRNTPSSERKQKPRTRKGAGQTTMQRTQQQPTTNPKHKPRRRKPRLDWQCWSGQSQTSTILRPRNCLKKVTLPDLHLSTTLPMPVFPHCHQSIFFDSRESVDNDGFLLPIPDSCYSLLVSFSMAVL